MALSGVVSKDVASNYKLSIEWTATQNISNNSSTVTAKMYWEADSYGYVNSTDTKDGAIIIDGTTYTFSGAGLADLNKGQKKLIATKSKTITHDADGTRDFYIDGYFDAEVSLSGSWYNRIDLNSKTFTLNTIPRKSTLSSSASFTAGSDFTISISRASSSFTHIAYIDVQAADGTWTFIKSINFSTSETSKNSEFDETSKTRIFTAIGGRSSATFRINLNTYSGSTNLGYNTYTGTVSVPAASIGEVTNGLAGADNKVYVDQDIYVGIARNDSEFTHTVAIKLGSFTKTLTGVGYGTTWTPSGTEQDSLYSAIGTSANNLKGTVTTTTYYNGVQVRSAVTKDVYYYVRPSINAPTFAATGITYEDINAVTLAVTGSKTYIIQNKSSLRVSIPTGSKAAPKNGATITKYDVTINGVTKSANFSSSATVNIDFGLVNSQTNVTASIAAVDSRGLSTTVTLPITVVPYSAPTVNANPKRRNSFEATIDIPVSGTFSTVTVGSTPKNGLQAISGTTSAIQYRYRENVAAAVFQPWADLTFPAPTGGAYTATAGLIVLDSTKSYVFEIRVSDKLSTTTVSKTVATGKPIMFVDADKNSVGIGMFPRSNNALYTQGEVHVGNPVDETQEIFLGFLADQPRIRVGGSSKGLQIQGMGDAVLAQVDNTGLFQTNQIRVKGSQYFTQGGGLDMQNSDIVNANGIYMADSADSGAEGINFLKSGKTPGSTTQADYDSLWAKDGKLLFNGTDIAASVKLATAPKQPTWANSWQAYFGGAYFKTVEGIVFMRGMMRLGSFGTGTGSGAKLAFTIQDADCRPVSNQVFYVVNDARDIIRLDINTDGTGNIFNNTGLNASNDWVNLNGIYWTTT